MTIASVKRLILKVKIWQEKRKIKRLKKSIQKRKEQKEEEDAEEEELRARREVASLNAIINA